MWLGLVFVLFLIKTSKYDQAWHLLDENDYGMHPCLLDPYHSQNCNHNNKYNTFASLRVNVRFSWEWFEILPHWYACVWVCVCVCVWVCMIVFVCIMDTHTSESTLIQTASTSMFINMISFHSRVHYLTGLDRFRSDGFIELCHQPPFGSVLYSRRNGTASSKLSHKSNIKGTILW